ncbi:MAG: 4Fe-4S dicluster domain-containing protein [Vulcanimicrobiota bacterium]
MSEQIQLSRREVMLGGASLVAATAAALSPLRFAQDVPDLDDFLQRHYKELSADEKTRLIARLKRKLKRKYKKDVEIKDPQPIPGVEFAYMLNLQKCIGCRRCVHACANENNLSRNPEMQYIRVLKVKKDRLSVEDADSHYEDEMVPDPDHFYMPVSCQQCRNPPCVKVCPVEATWQEKDGVVAIDYNWCIGCRYCEAACPYGARHFNWQEVTVPEPLLNPDMGLLTNRPRPQGVVEKCHFCLHRTREGKYPACLEVCPVGARKFGNILDPESEVSYILKHKRIFVLKEELNTQPRFYYFFD